MRETLALPVHDEVDVALRIEVDVLRAVPSGVSKSEPLDQRSQGFGVRIARREFHEFHAFDGWRRRQRREVGERRVSARRAFGREPFARGEQRAHAVDRDRRCGCAAKLVVEDFERQRPAIARAGRGVQIVDDRIIALSGIAAVMAAQRQRIHDERRGVRDLHERDLLARQIGDRLDRIAARADMEAVEDDSEIVAIGRAHDLPGRRPVLHASAPGKRLIADPHALQAGDVREFGEIARRPLGDRRSSRARRSSTGREGGRRVRCISSSLRRARSKFRCRIGSGIASKSRSGCRATISIPRSAAMRRASRGLPLKKVRSFSNSSTARKPAFAAAVSLPSSDPPMQTVAIDHLSIRPPLTSRIREASQASAARKRDRQIPR